MTAKKLLEAIGDINSEAIQDAKNDVFEISNSKHRESGRRLATILIAAILLIALAVSALAYFGMGDWFKRFFTERSGSGLSSGQQQYIDEKTVGIGQSVTSGDLTITVESALSDDCTIYVKLLVEAPEGTVLGGEDDLNFFFENVSFLASENWEQYDSYLRGAGGPCYVLDDEDGKSNTASLLLERTVTMAPDSGFSFRDGEVRRLRLENFCMTTKDYKEIPLFEGVWSFDIIYGDNGSSTVELISEPVHCQGRRGIGTYEDVWMNSFELSALGATCTYEFWDDGGLPEALDFIGTEAVMKDGSVIALSPGSGAISTAGIGSFTFRFDAPIALDEVDYILLPGDIIIPMPD